MKKLRRFWIYPRWSGTGSFEEETFSADGMKFIFHGVSAHPGHAKDKLVNAIKMAALLMNCPAMNFPRNDEDRYGFVHPAHGRKRRKMVEFIIRISIRRNLQPMKITCR
jgi:tripeptide aminopeptidase